MPLRMLREGILTSEPVNALTWQAELFYRRLMSVVDDFGRYYGKPSTLRAGCYPTKVDEVSDADITAWVGECVVVELIVAYRDPKGVQYVEIQKFGEPRAKKSRFPVSDGMKTFASVYAQSHANAPPSPSPSPIAFGDQEQSVAVAPPPQKASPKGSRLEPLWALPEAWADWALTERKDWTLVDVDRVGLTFRDHWHAIPGAKGRKTDWLATWRNWVRNERRDYKRRPDPPSRKERHESNMDILTGKVRDERTIEGIAKRVDRPTLLAVPSDLRQSNADDVEGRGPDRSAAGMG